MRELDGVDPSGAEKKSEEKGGSCTGSTVACAILVFMTAASRESHGPAVDGKLLSRAWFTKEMPVDLSKDNCN